MTRVWCQLALIDGRPQHDVAIGIVDGRFATIEIGVEPDALPDDSTLLGGFTEVTVVVTAPDGTTDEFCLLLADDGD